MEQHKPNIYMVLAILSFLDLDFEGKYIFSLCSYTPINNFGIVFTINILTYCSLLLTYIVSLVDLNQVVGFYDLSAYISLIWNQHLNHGSDMIIDV